MKVILTSLLIISLSLFYISQPKTLSQTRAPLFTPTVEPSSTPPPQVIVGLMGDLGLGRHITSTARNKNDFNWSFVGINPWLSQNDFNLANLESPIIKDCPTGFTGTFTFCGDNRFVPQLSSFILNLNNNHMLNYGPSGLTQTQKYLPRTFYDNFYTQNFNGITFGFIGYDFVTYPNLDKKEILSRISSLDSQVDWLIVSIHWGNEYLPQAEKWRVDFGKAMVDAGADIIHGHHPHVWQSFEVYQDKPIFYSFGNFIFDQSWSYETSHSQIARLTVTKDKIVSQELFPIAIKFNSQPWLMSP